MSKWPPAPARRPNPRRQEAARRAATARQARLHFAADLARGLAARLTPGRYDRPDITFTEGCGEDLWRLIVREDMGAANLWGVALYEARTAYSERLRTAAASVAMILDPARGPKQAPAEFPGARTCA